MKPFTLAISAASRVVCSVALCALLLGLVAPVTVFAQKEKDNTGTNPINFTYDFRFITEMQRFTSDGGSLVKSYVEYRVPLGKDMTNVLGDPLFANLGKQFGLRFRGYYNVMSVNDATAAPFGAHTVSGIGDFDARLIWLAYAKGQVGVAPGLEAFFNTSSNDALGPGKNVLAPTIFLGFFKFMGQRSLFAPGYQYQFDIGGDPDRGAVSRSVIDLYFVWILAQGKNWFLLDPQIILDHENATQFMIADAEWGFMIVPKSGISGWVRPGIGVGADRPIDWNFEFGLKYVWR